MCGRKLLKKKKKTETSVIQLEPHNLLHFLRGVSAWHQPWKTAAYMIQELGNTKSAQTHR